MCSDGSNDLVILYNVVTKLKHGQVFLVLLILTAVHLGSIGKKSKFDIKGDVSKWIS